MDKIREKFEKTYNTEYMIYDDRFNRYLISLKNGESVVNVDQLGKMMDELNIRWTTFGNCSKSRDKEIEELKEELEIHKHVLSAQPEKYTYLTFQKIEKENKKLIEALEHILEYWNRDRNDKAMDDALWEIIKTSEEALKKVVNNEYLSRN